MKKHAAFVCCAVGAATTASASIIGTTGAATLIATPPDAQLDVITSNTQVFVWNEDQAVALSSAIVLDAMASGIYDSFGDLVSVPVPAGTVLSSHYIHFDTPPPSVTATASGSVRFDADILGVIVLGDVSSPAHLDGSDFLGSATLYPDGVDLRGLELSINSDNFGISADRRTLAFNLTAGIPGDFFRVITLPVPGPGSALVLAMAASMCASRRRRTN